MSICEQIQTLLKVNTFYVYLDDKIYSFNPYHFKMSEEHCKFNIKILNVIVERMIEQKDLPYNKEGKLMSYQDLAEFVFYFSPDANRGDDIHTPYLSYSQIYGNYFVNQRQCERIIRYLRSLENKAIYNDFYNFITNYNSDRNNEHLTAFIIKYFFVERMRKHNLSEDIINGMLCFCKKEPEPEQIF